MDIKSQIAPKGLEFKPNQFIISDKYCTILTVINYPKLIGPGFLSNITNMPGVKVVVKHINDEIGSKPVTLVTGKGLVYLAKKFNAEIDESIQPDA